MSTATTLQNNTTAQSQSVSSPSNTGLLLLQRKCACGRAISAPLAGECEQCTKRRLQTKLTIGASNDPLEQEADRIADQVMASPNQNAISGAPIRIQRFTVNPSGQEMEVPSSVERVLASPGRPLETGLREEMEGRFGYDFSRVRVHTGSAAEQSAKEVNANAYTVGNNVVFGTGQFVPGIHEGRRLIVHELTHVLQQSTTGQYTPTIGLLQRQAETTIPRDRSRGRRRASGRQPSGMVYRSFTAFEGRAPEAAGLIDELDSRFSILVIHIEDIIDSYGEEGVRSSDAVNHYERYLQIASSQRERLVSNSFSALAIYRWISALRNALHLQHRIIRAFRQEVPDDYMLNEIIQERAAVAGLASDLLQLPVVQAGRPQEERPEVQSPALSDESLFRTVISAVDDLFRRYHEGVERSPGIVVPPLLDLLIEHLGHHSERFQRFFEYLRTNESEWFQRIQLEGRTVRDLQAYRGIEGIEEFRVPGYHERTLRHIVVGSCGFDRSTGEEEEATGAGIGFDVLVGFVPIFGQIADGRDLACTTYRIIAYEQERSNQWTWFGLAMTLVGAIPGVGDAFKGLGQILRRYARFPGLLDESILGNIVRFIGRGNVEGIAGNAYALYLTVSRQWSAFTRSGVSLFRQIIEGFANFAEAFSLIPRTVFTNVLAVIETMLPAAYRGAGDMFVQVLEALASGGSRLTASVMSRTREIRRRYRELTGTGRLLNATEVENAVTRLDELERRLLEAAEDSPLAQQLYREFEETFEFVTRRFNEALEMPRRRGSISELDSDFALTEARRTSAQPAGRVEPSPEMGSRLRSRTEGQGTELGRRHTPLEESANEVSAITSTTDSMPEMHARGRGVTAGQLQVDEVGNVSRSTLRSDHTLTFTHGGRFVTCSICQHLTDRYRRVLQQDPNLQAELQSLEARADVARNVGNEEELELIMAETAELEEVLRQVEFDFPRLTQGGNALPPPQRLHTAQRIRTGLAEDEPFSIHAWDRLTTDALGRTRGVTGRLAQSHLHTGTGTSRAARNAAQEQGTYDAGHLRSRLLGGRGGLDNTFPQWPSINRGKFRFFEGQVARLVGSLPANAQLTFSVQLRYSSINEVPDLVVYHIRIPGQRTVSAVFDNLNPSASSVIDFF